MATANPPLPTVLPVSVLRFGGVEIDAARHRLLVDGREVRVQRLVFNLLLALCEANGHVLSRDLLFATLWPDGVFPADESLSQLVFKLRNALAPYGGAVVTVRQVGLRLAAEVERISAAAPDPDLTRSEAEPQSAAPLPEGATAAAGMAAGPAPAAVRPRWRWQRTPLAWALLAALGLLLAAALLLRTAPPAVVSAGFALQVEDVQASSPQTLEILRRAFEADADGNQSAARVLMETAHDADPRTPVPAMFLTYWSGALGDTAAGERWAAERDRRMDADTPTYLVLLARFLSRRDASALARLKLESLLLQTRPGAALIRLAHAHHHLQRNERTLALEQLRQVDLRAAGRRRAPIVLGDLASLGDLTTVETALRATDALLDAPGRAYVEARLRVAQGRFAEAREAFDRTLQLAQSAERPDLVRGSALHAAMMSAELGDFADGRRRLEQAIGSLRDEHAYLHVWQSTLLLATLPSVSAAEAQALLERLAGEVPEGARSDLCLDVELVAALIAQAAPPALRCDGADRSDDYARRGGTALAEGLRAQLAGATADARRALARAQSEGVDDTVLAPYAELLAARLAGNLPQPAVPDPPYPAWHRWALRWRSRVPARPSS